MSDEKAFLERLQWYIDHGHKKFRDDITCRPLAVELGYSIDYSKGFDFSLSFDKGNKRLWYCRKGWACAEIIEGYFRNHRYYDELEEALRTEA